MLGCVVTSLMAWFRETPYLNPCVDRFFDHGRMPKIVLRVHVHPSRLTVVQGKIIALLSVANRNKRKKGIRSAYVCKAAHFYNRCDSEDKQEIEKEFLNLNEPFIQVAFDLDGSTLLVRLLTCFSQSALDDLVLGLEDIQQEEFRARSLTSC